jgi:hypothetical protein
MGMFTRKYRIAVSAFPYLRILPERGESRLVAGTGEQSAVHEERVSIEVCQGSIWGEFSKI